MRWGLPALVLFAVAGLSGCGHLQRYKLVRPDRPIRGVVSLSPSTTEIISSSTVSMLLKGRTAADNYPATLAAIPVVASIKPDYELIKKINPDLVLYDASLYNAEDVSKIKALGIPSLGIDATTVSQFENELYQLGDILQSQTGTSDYVDRIEVAKNSAAASKPATPLKVAVVMPGHGGAPLICGTKSFIADAVRICGGEMVGPATDRFVSMNPETFVSDNPDLIVIPSTAEKAKQDVAELVADPKLGSVKAVRAKRFAIMDQDVLLRRGSRVDKLLLNLARGFSMSTQK